MTGNNNLYRVAFVEGDVTITHEHFGSRNAERGMRFTDAAGITIQTGLSSRVIVITPRGDAMDIGEMSHQVISRFASQDFVDTLRNLYVTARDMKSARRFVTLAAAVNG